MPRVGQFTDELAHLRSVRGLLRHAEGVLLAHYASAVPSDRAIVEIGAFKGKSAIYMAHGARLGQGAHVTSIDLWDLGGQKIKARKFADPVAYRRYQEQVAEHGVADRVTQVRARGHEAARTWAGPPVCLLFVDGDHSFEGCLADFVTWERHIPIGGVVALHDYDVEYEQAHPGAGVMRVCDEHIAQLPDWEPLPVVERIWSARRIG